jgi:hypothetical protein
VRPAHELHRELLNLTIEGAAAWRHTRALIDTPTALTELTEPDICDRAAEAVHPALKHGRITTLERTRELPHVPRRVFKKREHDGSPDLLIETERAHSLLNSVNVPY